MIPILDHVCQLLFKIKINQLPVFAARWGHMGHRYFSQFLFVKNHKIKNIEAGKNLYSFETLRILEIFWCMIDLIQKPIKFYIIKLATDFY
jgi:hypothetical protein